MFVGLMSRGTKRSRGAEISAPAHRRPVPSPSPCGRGSGPGRNDRGGAGRAEPLARHRACPPPILLPGPEQSQRFLEVVLWHPHPDLAEAAEVDRQLLDVQRFDRCRDAVAFEEAGGYGGLLVALHHQGGTPLSRVKIIVGHPLPPRELVWKRS